MSDKTLSTKAKIGVGYIRESTEEQDKGFSPDNQKRTIEEYADKHGIKIVTWYKDLISGTKASKRDDFQLMITDAMQKKFEVILVFHTSRFARNVQEARQYKNLLRKKQGIDVIFVTQQFGDYNNPSSFLNEGVNELFDEYYSKQLSFWVRSTMMEKRRQGFQNGNPPYGYYKKQLGFDKDKGRPIYAKEWLVHPQESKIVKKIYELYATGRHSYRDVAVAINALGARSKKGEPLTYSTIKDILCNQVYLGLVFSQRRGYPTQKGVHPAIISQELFDKVQMVIRQRHNTQGRPVAQHRFYLLQDLLYCWHCRKNLRGKEDAPSNTAFIPKMYCQSHTKKDKDGKPYEQLVYACKMRRENKSCKQPIVPVEGIDAQVVQLMEGFNIPNDIIEMTLGRLKALFKQTAKTAGDFNVIAKLEARKKKINFIFQNTEQYTHDEYLALVKDIDAELAKYDNLGLVSNNSKVKEAEYIRKTEKFLKDFKKFWRSDIGDEERRAWIQMLVKRVWVKDRKVVAVEPHDDFKPLFSAHRKVLGQAPSPTPNTTINLKNAAPLGGASSFKFL